MKKFSIQLCLLGHQRNKKTIDKLCKFQSELFYVENCISINHLPPTDLEWCYSDQAICNLLRAKNIDNRSVDLCLCFIDSPIELNYFTRDLHEFDNKTVLCSFYQAEDIFAKKEVNLFNYVHGIVLNELIQISTLQKVDEKYFLHDDTRNCLFDMCGIKNDIALKYETPRLCSQCTAKIEALAIDKDFLLQLNKEFKSFKKMFFYRLLDFIKQRPILSLLITFIVTIIINILSACIFDFIKALCC